VRVWWGSRSAQTLPSIHPSHHQLPISLSLPGSTAPQSGRPPGRSASCTSRNIFGRTVCVRECACVRERAGEKERRPIPKPHQSLSYLPLCVLLFPRPAPGLCAGMSPRSPGSSVRQASCTCAGCKGVVHVKSERGKNSALFGGERDGLLFIFYLSRTCISSILVISSAWCAAGTSPGEAFMVGTGGGAGWGGGEDRCFFFF